MNPTKENPMDRFDPTNFDAIEHERRTTVRGLEITHQRGVAIGHDYKLTIPVDDRTAQGVTLNAKELRRWAMLLAEAAVRHHPRTTCPECAQDVEVHVQDLRDRYVGDHGLDETCPGSGLEAPADTCPACRGDVHVDLSGAVWTTSRYASDEDLRRAAIAACKAVWGEAYGGDFEEDCPAKEKWIAEELAALRPALAALGINTAAAS